MLGSLLSYNKTVKVASNESQALVTENRGRSEGKMPRSYNDKSRGRSKSRGKDNACYHCGKQGHVEKIVECGSENKIKKTRKKKRTRTPLPLSQEVMKMLRFSLMNAYILVIR